MLKYIILTLGIVGYWYTQPTRVTVVTQPQPEQSAPAATNARHQFAVDLATALGNPQPSESIARFIESWAQAEGGSATFNPLNTTQPMNGATDYNRVGVKNYATYTDGLNATVQTLRSGYNGYGEIMAGIQTNDAQRALYGLSAAPWGTSATLTMDIYNEGLSAAAGATSGKAQVTATMAIGANYYATGEVWCSVGQKGCQHYGIDYIGSPGDAVYLPFDMVVYATGAYPPGPTEGGYIQGTLGDGSVLYLGHLAAQPNVATGTRLAAGTQIGVMNALAHTHVQLAPAGKYGPCATDGTCLDFEHYYLTH